MNIYLGESLFPSFTNDLLVFKEKGITLGDWKEDRKVSLEVPISEVRLFLSVSYIFRMSNITAPCLRTFL